MKKVGLVLKPKLTQAKSLVHEIDAWLKAQGIPLVMDPRTAALCRDFGITDFEELHGDRHFGDDPAIVGGVARLQGRPVVVIGQEKGRSVAQKVAQ